MSTSAETALDWLREEQPAADRVQQMIHKLQERIEKYPTDDDRIQGSIEALDVLEASLEGTGGDTVAATASTPTPAGLDTSPLVDHAHVAEERPPAEKRAVFEALRKQMEK